MKHILSIIFSLRQQSDDSKALPQEIRCLKIQRQIQSAQFIPAASASLLTYEIFTEVLKECRVARGRAATIDKLWTI